MTKILIGNIKGSPGDSAYQIAVNNGYVGTEEEWLASLSSDGVALQNHIDSERPHVNAESGKDFAGWFNAYTT